MSEPNASVYEQVTADYLQRDLAPAERVLLDRIGVRWGAIAMLDLGVGAGRTAYTFAPISRSYVGVDYAQAMINACKARFGESAQSRFMIGDARAMPNFSDGEFDVVLFSFNGLDYIGHDDRQRALCEIRRVLAPGGSFLFSSHALGRFPFALERPVWSWHRPVRSARRRLGAWRRWRRLTSANRGEDARVAHERGWAVLTDEAHNYSLRTYYVSPTEAARQISAAGLTLEVMLDAEGHVPADPALCQDPWMHYLCSAPEAGQAR